MAGEREPSTVLHTILTNLREHPTKTAFFWLDKNCEVVSSINYKQLNQASQDIATALLNITSRDGRFSRTVVLCYTPGVEFISVFLGCLRAGLIPGK